MIAAHEPQGEDRRAWVEATAAELVRRGLLDGGGAPEFEPLTGGVSSDIWIVRRGEQRVVVKRALAKLNVAQEWRAPVARNAADADWLRIAGRIVPGSAPQVLYQDAAAGLFVMSYIEPARAPVWKARLLAGEVDPAFAAAVGRTIGRIHAATAGQPDIAQAFANGTTFHALRIAPYLEAAAERHPALARRLLAIARTTARHRDCLIHGDVSPKNILVGGEGPILLDAECATYGDPAFDVAFCLNHLLLKGLVVGDRGALAGAFESLTAGLFRGGDLSGKPRRQSAGGGASPGAAACPGRWQVAGRIHHHGYAARSCQGRCRPFPSRPEFRPGRRLQPLDTGSFRDGTVMDTRIEQVRARAVWDSRGRPTVEAEVGLADGSIGRAIAPAGASVGSGEALDLRDGGAILGGFGVERALDNIRREVDQRVRGRDAADQRAIDRDLIDLDGTRQKSRIGGNALVAVSMAVLHAAAASARLPLHAYLAKGNRVSIPLPQIQIFGGGAHAGRRVDIQDFLVLCPNAGSLWEALRRTAEVYRTAGRLLSDAGRLYGIADEGGWWPAFSTNEEVLDALVRAIEGAGLIPGDDVFIAVDIAASEFRNASGRYVLGLEKREFDSDGFAELLERWIDRYPILSVEDPFAEDDRRGISGLHRRGRRPRPGRR